VERQLKGQTATEDVAEAAGELAILGARPLQHNAYKIPLMRNLVRRAIRGEA
jgi:xanthine dehydrogenase YagS FAD-binding subunit